MSAGCRSPSASYTGRFTTLPTPMMPTSGWLMIGVEISPPMLPIDVTVNVPPFRSSSLLLPAFASSLSRSISAAIAGRSFLSASLTTGTISPLGAATATPMW